MDAAEAKVQKVLEGSKQFLVPHYQRPYSWRARDWEILWRDVLELVGDPSSKPHFLGSIVTAPARSVPEGVEKRLLIDGQQRLTTVLVLLALVRDRASALGNHKLADKIGDLITNRHEEGHDHYKLLPTQGETPADGDRDAFIALVDRQSLQSTSGIQELRTFFWNKLLRQDAPNLDDLVRVLIGKLTLVSIILDEKDNPHRIFESLNGKGRPLSQADLIRNYFFMRTDQAQHEPMYRTLWQPMQKRLGEESLTEFIRHYLMQFGTVINESDVYSTLKERVDGSSRAATDHLKELAEYSSYYDVLLHAEKAPSAAIRPRLARLNRLEVTVAYPFLLPAYADFVRGELSDHDLGRLLDIIETYVVRRFVCGVPTHGLNKVFTPLYQQAKKRGSLVDATRDLLAERSCPTDGDFRDRLGTTRLYGGGERREKTKLILERLEEAIGHKERVDASNMTIEHVMPQTLTDWWKDHLGDDWEEEHSSLLHTLGNLTLTSYNSELSNETYPEKQRLLETSHIELNRYFSRTEQWNAGEIERRADELVELALSIWPYFGPERASDSDRVPSSIDVTSTQPTRLVFRGISIPVKSWADVLTATLEGILRIGPDEFQRVTEELPNVVNLDASAFRRIRRLKRLSNGAYLEANLSASAIHRVCFQALQVVGIGPEEWHVDYVSLRPEDGSGQSSQDSHSQVKQLQLDFWTQVRAVLAASGKFSTLRSPKGFYYYNVAIGRSGFWLELIANVAERAVAVRLCMNGDVASAVEALQAEQAAIEASLGFAADWRQSPDQALKVIKVVQRATLTDRSTWPGSIDWITKTTLAFWAVFRDRIANLDV